MLIVGIRSGEKRMLNCLLSSNPPYWRKLEKLVDQVEAVGRQLVFQNLVQLLKPLRKNDSFGEALLDHGVHAVLSGKHFLQLGSGGFPYVLHNNVLQVAGVLGLEQAHLLVHELQD